MGSARSNRVIIVGGSISGLIMALALEKAEIDFLVLERGEIAPQLGASTGVFPHGQRILDQLGVFLELSKCTVPMQHARVFDSWGNIIDEEIGVLAKARKRYGYPVLFAQRVHFIQCIYKNIQNKSRILTNKKVVGISEDGEKVIATTEDGSTYEGILLVGADGIHSTVRGILAAKANKTRDSIGSRLETTNGGMPGFCTEYRCLFAVSKLGGNCEMPRGTCHWTYGRGYSVTVCSGEPDRFFWFLFTKVEKTQDISSPRYTDQDAEDIIAQHRDMKISDNFTVGDAWAARVRGNLLSQEEGILDQWNYGRTVLIGDAIHKMSVNAGLGAMTAMEGIVHLVNLLEPILSPKSPTRRTLTNELCDEVFAKFRERHMPRLLRIAHFSAQATRYEAQENWIYWLFSFYIMPWLGDWGKLYRLRTIFEGGPTFDFLAKDLNKDTVA